MSDNLESADITNTKLVSRNLASANLMSLNLASKHLFKASENFSKCTFSEGKFKKCQLNHN